jgi:hypothetical protein
MNRIVTICILIQAFILSACSDKVPYDYENFDIKDVHENDNNELIDLTLVNARELVFLSDTNSRNFSLYPAYFYDSLTSKEFFVNRNEILDGLDFYDYNSGEMVKRLVFPSDGPGSVAELSGFFIKSMDSIFIADRNKNQVLLVNDSGQVQDQYALPVEHFRSTFTTILSKFFVVEDKLIMNYSAYETAENTGGTPSAILYDLKKKELIRMLPPLSPHQLADNNYSLNQTGQRINQGHGNSTVSRFGPLPFIYHYNLEQAELIMHQLKSKRQKDQVKPMGLVPKDELRYLEESYMQTIYDPYRKLYYSIYRGDIPPKNRDNEDNTLEDMQMSIIIADTLFRYRGEIILEKDKYLRTPFISKEGLLMPKSHMNFKGEEEGKMKYDLFKIEQL